MTTTPDQPTTPVPDGYARRGDGPWHIYPSDRDGVTTCGVRIGQYVKTQRVKELPSMTILCPVCVDFHKIGRYRPVGSRQRRPS